MSTEDTSGTRIFPTTLRLLKRIFTCCVNVL
jgi:hypothetical protein